METKKNDRFAVMILRVIMALFVYATIFTVNGQEGFKIGPQVTILSSRSYVKDSLEDNFNFRYKSGFRIGLSAQYGFTQKFVLGSGLSFTNKGYRVFNDTNSSGNVLKRNHSHIELPVNMILKFRMGATSRMRFLLGATLNYQISSSDKTLKNDKESFIIREESIQTIYPMANLGVEIASESKSGNMFVFGVYYSQSFSEQTRLNVYTSANATDKIFALGYRGTHIGIGLSYLFDFKNLKREEVFFY